MTSEQSLESYADLSNAINCLGVFQAAPNRLAFKSIYRVLHYLHNYPNIPLVYPQEPFTANTTFTCHTSKGDVCDSIKIPHCYCGHVDVSFCVVPYLSCNLYDVIVSENDFRWSDTIRIRIIVDLSIDQTLHTFILYTCYFSLRLN